MQLPDGQISCASLLRNSLRHKGFWEGAGGCSRPCLCYLGCRRAPPLRGLVLGNGQAVNECRRRSCT